MEHGKHVLIPKMLSNPSLMGHTRLLVIKTPQPIANCLDKQQGQVLHLDLALHIKLSKRVNLAIEERLSFVKDDLLDGQRWGATPVGDATLTTHYDTFSFLSVGLNINIF